MHANQPESQRQRQTKCVYGYLRSFYSCDQWFSNNELSVGLNYSVYDSYINSLSKLFIRKETSTASDG